MTYWSLGVIVTKSVNLIHGDFAKECHKVTYLHFAKECRKVASH